MRWPGFCGPSYTVQSKIAAYDRSVNWFCQKNESGTAQSDYAMYPTPGYAVASVMPTSPGRVIFALNGVAFAIGGAALYDVTGDTPVLRAQGFSDDSGDVAQIVSNGDAGHQLLFRADETLYALDLNAPVTGDELIDPPTDAPNDYLTLSGTALDGYYGYAYTYVTTTGETTASPRIATFNPGPLNINGGKQEIRGILTGASVVTDRRLYRTEVQANSADTLTAQLKLVGTIADNSTTIFLDNVLDASLGVDAPLSNTATVTVEALTEIPDIISNQIAYLNTYGLSLYSQESEVRFSEPLDFTDWPALNVFRRSDASDRWLGMLVNTKEVWLFGSQTTSVYFNDADDPDEPFKPNPNVLIQIGTIAPNACVMVDGQPMWIGQGINGAGVVYRASGYTPVRVSTFATEFAFAAFASTGQLAAAEGSTYQENGHVFYELTFETLGEHPGATWVFDATEGLWHERGRRAALDFVELDTRGHAQLDGRQLTLSRTNGNVYHQSADLHVDTNGVGITRLRRAPHLCEENKGLILDSLELKFEPGVALASGQGSDPQFAMRMSKNGGQTWSNARTRSAGRIGEYDRRVEWKRLGRGRDRLIEITVSDPVFWPIIDAFIGPRVGTS